MSEQINFEDLASHFASNDTVTEAKWFGKRCISVNGKAFAVLFGEDIAYKLTPDDLAEALEITGTKLFDPRGKGNPFKEWAQIPVNESDKWIMYSEKAMTYVDSLKK